MCTQSFFFFLCVLYVFQTIRNGYHSMYVFYGMNVFGFMEISWRHDRGFMHCCAFA